MVPRVYIRLYIRAYIRAYIKAYIRAWSFWGLRGGMLCALRRCLEGLAGRLDPSWDDFESFSGMAGRLDPFWDDFESFLGHVVLSEADFGGFRPYVYDGIYDGFGSWRSFCIVFYDKIVESR